MAYTDLATITIEMTLETLIQATDDNDTGNVDTNVVDWAIGEAKSLIDAHNNGRYPIDIPDGDVPTFIKSIATNFAVWYLYKRKLILTMPESLKTCYDNWIQFLKDAQESKISPFPEDQAQQRVVVNTRPKVFTASKLGQYRCPN